MKLRILFMVFIGCFNSISYSQTVKKSTVKAPHDFIKILWLDNHLSINLNEEYLQKITDPQRAALGYIATNVGNECNWDGAQKTDKSNLKCKLLSSINLDYQCSKQNLLFFKKWFKNDTNILDKLKDCNAIASSEDGQDFITSLKMETTTDTITIIYSAIGISVENNSKWKWVEKSIYSYTDKNIKQISRENLSGGFF